MAKSPLMYGGQLPITDNVTLNLVTNELALLINSHSANDLPTKAIVLAATSPDLPVTHTIYQALHLVLRLGGRRLAGARRWLS